VFAGTRRKNFLGRTYDWFFRHDEWNIGIVREPIHAFLRPGARPVIDWLPPLEHGKFLADPFGFQDTRNQRLYILCEEFDYSTSRGRIVSIEIANGISTSAPEHVIDLQIHASYPYLFEDQGETYCIPETHQAREIGLYKAEQFPYKWVKVAALVRDFAGVDGTLFRHDGRFWLASTSKEHGPSDKLFIWHAPDLLGPWRPHAANPVKADIRSSRPAGTPFLYSGQLYRPAQDCSRTSGGRIVLNRVIRLTSTEFEEEPAAIIEPDANGPYPHGTHTISAAGNVTLVDGKRMRFIKSAFKPHLIEGLTKAKTGSLFPTH
jgi:hypothetical protein